MDNLISRQAAIEAMTADNLNRNLDSVHDDDLKRAARAAQRALARLPAAQRWIPVTEKLPAAFHQVLCYGHNGIMIDYFSGETTEIYGNPLFMISEAKITHWMPLPETPKEEA